MNRLGLLSRAGTGALLFCSATAAAAPGACRTLTRDTVAVCATRNSLAIQTGAQDVSAAEARVLAAAPWLPARPVLGVSAGRATRSGGRSGLAWRAELAQELGLGGQRAARGRAARAEVAAKKHAALAVTRDVEAEALLLFFEVIAADDEARLERRAERLLERAETAVRVLADQGGAPSVDAEIARATRIKATQLRLEAERRGRRARAALAFQIGASEVVVSGLLEPLPRAGLAWRDPEELPEVATWRAEQRAEQARAEGFRSGRIPNLSVSLFVEHDGYDERVLGGGVQIPLPLPHPAVTTFSGEIREAESLAIKASHQAALKKREAVLRWRTATEDYEARVKALRSFDSERVSRAERALADLADAVDERRLAVRDAIVAQQALLDFLRGHVAARHALCRASIELRRASGQPIGGRSP
ncbi:MAG: TolC family protein [Polyangiaceae bacterium]|nr:TolC family protein [Polyangiaceae bacterium]